MSKKKGSKAPRWGSKEAIAETARSVNALGAQSAAGRSRGILALDDPGYWDFNQKEAFEAACALPLDSGERKSCWVGGRLGVCEAFIKAMLIASNPRSVEALWRVNGGAFKGDQARQFVEMGGLDSERANAWPLDLRRSVLEALGSALPERILWPFVKNACHWDQDQLRPKAPSWIVSAGLLTAGMAQRSDWAARESGKLGELASGALWRWGDEMSSADKSVWIELARSAPEFSDARKVRMQFRLLAAGQQPREQALAICESFKEAGLLAPVDIGLAQAAVLKRSEKTHGLRFESEMWQDEGAAREASVAWGQWSAPQSPEQAARGFEELLALDSELRGRAPPWRVVRELMSPSALSWQAGLTRWIEEKSAIGDVILKEDFCLGLDRVSLPVEIIASRDEESFEKIARWLAKEGLMEERWPTGRGSAEETIGELTERWPEGRAIWERALVGQIVEAGALTRRAGPRI